MILLGAATVARGEVLPDFHLLSNLREAEHILLVTEGDRVDGDLTVLEAWRGSFAAGSRVRLPEAARFTEEPFHLPGGHPPSCARMLVFLKGPADAPVPATRDLACSTVWLEGGNAFTWQQAKGPCRVVREHLFKDESALRAAVTDYDRFAARLAKALAIDDGPERARALEPLLGSWWVDDRAFAGIRECGEDALPILWKVLDDPERWRWHCPAVTEIGALAGDRGAARLAAVTAAELPYWREIAPTLKKGWANGQDPVLSCRYGKLQAILHVLAELRRADARETAEALREICRRHPLFGGYQGVGKLIDAIDTYLNAIGPR